MGWSSKDILGGDEPMDAANFIATLCGCPENYEGNSDDFLTKENLEKYQEKILKEFKKEKVSIIYVQAFAAYMVSVGAEFKEFPVEDCIRCLRMDDWAKKDLEREYHINYLINVLENYKNVPTSYYDVNTYYNYETGKNSKYCTYILEIFKKTKFFKNKINISASICIFGGFEYAIVVLFKDDKTTENKMKKYFSNAISSFFELKIVYVSSNDFILNPNPDA